MMGAATWNPPPPPPRGSSKLRLVHIISTLDLKVSNRVHPRSVVDLTTRILDLPSNNVGHVGKKNTCLWRDPVRVFVDDASVQQQGNDYRRPIKALVMQFVDCSVT